jgi:hypothetical protein
MPFFSWVVHAVSDGRLQARSEESWGSMQQGSRGKCGEVNLYTNPGENVITEGVEVGIALESSWEWKA